MTASALTRLVRPLVWVETNPGVFVAETVLGVWARFDGHYMTPEGYGGISAADPEAAAQADYAARIIAALDPAALAAMLAEAEQRGREAEREECARVADGYHQEALAWAKTVRGLSEHIDETDSSRIAAAIRTRGPA